MKGQAGKILRLNLTDKTIKTMDTKQYEEWMGGWGLAAAIWYDLVPDKTISGFDPRHPVVMAPGFFAGTLVPASSRTDIVGNGVEGYPIDWFSESNAGGRFGTATKLAGYDAITIEGASEKPVWVNVVDNSVEIRDASDFWGMDTYATEQTIFNEVSGHKMFGGWVDVKDGTRTTQRPSVCVIGPFGENLGREAVILHDRAHAFGEGGFGGIWGSKKLKAISVWGTGDVEVADPKALLDARIWSKENYAANVDAPKPEPWLCQLDAHFGGTPGFCWAEWDPEEWRPYGCTNCHINCTARTASGLGSEAMCVEASSIYKKQDAARQGKKNPTAYAYDADGNKVYTLLPGILTDLIEKLGVDARLVTGVSYLQDLYNRGLVGPGKTINTDLDFERYNEPDFVADFINRIAYRREIGNDIAEGWSRATAIWGIYDEESKRSTFPRSNQGYTEHSGGPVELEWTIGNHTIYRDTNSHQFRNMIQSVAWKADRSSTRIGYEGAGPCVTAEQLAKIVADRSIPFNDPRFIDSSEEIMYSETMAKRAAWLLWHNFFWKNSMGLCDAAYPDFVNPYAPGCAGITPLAEERFFKAVTGTDLSFADGMYIGRKMGNLNRAVLVMQGAHRDKELAKESQYVDKTTSSNHPLPQFLNGKWVFEPIAPRSIDRDGFEQLKTKYYTLEEWDTKTGWPTRSTLEKLGLKNVADDLAKLGKLS
jgi:aldehyde:ferredoxin oxidoreductase